jgi:hypothetical protein
VKQTIGFIKETLDRKPNITMGLLAREVQLSLFNQNLGNTFKHKFYQVAREQCTIFAMASFIIFLTQVNNILHQLIQI